MAKPRNKKGRAAAPVYQRTPLVFQVARLNRSVPYSPVGKWMSWTLSGLEIVDDFCAGRLGVETIIENGCGDLLYHLGYDPETKQKHSESVVPLGLRMWCVDISWVLIPELDVGLPIESCHRNVVEVQVEPSQMAYLSSVAEDGSESVFDAVNRVLAQVLEEQEGWVPFSLYVKVKCMA